MTIAVDLGRLATKQTPYLTLCLCMYTSAKIEFLKLAQFGKRWSEANTEPN